VITDLKAEVERVARSDAKVLITGESGSGKEVVARAINDASGRAQTFVPVNCAGIPETLLESELFGHVKGSFTGAYRDKPGKLEMADHGTIFLDEIGEMTLRMQGLLLRFLETGEIQKVGAERMAKATDVRVMAATNKNLKDLISQGQFREDLFYRINVIHLVVPPLRERREDIPLLIEHFLTRFTGGALVPAVQNGGGAEGYLGAKTAGNGAGGNGHASGVNRHSPVRAISSEAMDRLCEYHWPGNVRQVENIVERLVVTGRHDVIDVRDLPHEVLTPQQYGIKPAFERRRTVAEDLFKRLVSERQSFWETVYPLYMNREITRANVRELVHKGLEQARGNYKIVLRLFNMEPTDYKRFLNFLRKHDCQLPFKEYR
jgi:two-component system NtrC family response regulator